MSLPRCVAESSGHLDTCRRFSWSMRRFRHAVRLAHVSNVLRPHRLTWMSGLMCSLQNVPRQSGHSVNEPHPIHANPGMPLYEHWLHASTARSRGIVTPHTWHMTYPCGAMRCVMTRPCGLFNRLLCIPSNKITPDSYDW